MNKSVTSHGMHGNVSEWVCLTSVAIHILGKPETSNRTHSNATQVFWHNSMYSWCFGSYLYVTKWLSLMWIQPSRAQIISYFALRRTLVTRLGLIPNFSFLLNDILWLLTIQVFLKVRPSILLSPSQSESLSSKFLRKSKFLMKSNVNIENSVNCWPSTNDLLFPNSESSDHRHYQQIINIHLTWPHQRQIQI